MPESWILIIGEDNFQCFFLVRMLECIIGFEDFKQFESMCYQLLCIQFPRLNCFHQQRSGYSIYKPGCNCNIMSP